MSDINEILREYTAGEADLETTNAALADPREAPAVQKEVDMRRRMDLAGKQAEQTCRRGRFLVTCDEMGYAVKARRL